MMNKEQPVTFAKHDCDNCRNVVYTNTEHYTMDRCMICERII